MAEEALPQSFGRYRPVEKLGSGAIGTVYRAHDPLIDRFVAIKIIRLDALDDAQKTEYRARFKIEAQAGGRCSHPAIIAIHDAGEADGQPYLVMEYVEGRTLRAILADPAARQALNPVALMDELLGALGYAHARKIIHRDIKPANVMITPDFRVKVADFGIARLDDSSQTQTGEILGTPSYMAPEQVIGAPVDHRADLFSAAAILFAILTGRPPFAGNSLSETLARLANDREADFSPVTGPAVALIPVLRQALAKNPAHRLPDAASLAAAIRAAATQTATAAPSANTADATILTTPAAKPPPSGVAPQAAEPASALLASYIGPIARLTVTRAIAQAPTLDALLDRLVQAANRPDEAPALRIKLQETLAPAHAKL
jgi:serine/threonine-protein kinase